MAQGYSKEFSRSSVEYVYMSFDLMHATGAPPIMVNDQNFCMECKQVNHSVLIFLFSLPRTDWLSTSRFPDDSTCDNDVSQGKGLQ